MSAIKDVANEKVRRGGAARRFRSRQCALRKQSVVLLLRAIRSLDRHFAPSIPELRIEKLNTRRCRKSSSRR